jgi:hypothetical protein
MPTVRVDRQDDVVAMPVMLRVPAITKRDDGFMAKARHRLVIHVAQAHRMARTSIQDELVGYVSKDTHANRE